MGIAFAGHNIRSASSAMSETNLRQAGAAEDEINEWIALGRAYPEK